MQNSKCKRKEARASLPARAGAADRAGAKARTTVARRLAVTFAFCLLTFTFAAQAASTPYASARLLSVNPTGARQGTTVLVEFGGANLDDPTGLYFSNPGITAQRFEISGPLKKAEDQPRVLFKVSVGKDVPAGDYDVRFVGKQGVSNQRTFVVGDVAECTEKEPNNTKPEATRVELNSIINAKIGASEDVDWYVFSAKKDQRVLVECHAWRIDSRLDGFMWVYGSDGKQIAMSQDSDVRDEKRDPFIDFDVPSDGDYFVKITDFTYNGSADYFYRLSIGTGPYIDFLSPAGAPPGKSSDITIFGRNLPGGEKTELMIDGRPLQKIVKKIEVPSDPLALLKMNELVRPWSTNLDGMEVRVKSESGSSNAKLLIFDALPQMTEKEPNDNRAQAQRLEIPCAVTGHFAPRDPDFFIFTAKKNEKFSIDVVASRIGSPADPDMEILKADDSVLASPQDNGENIGQLRFTSNSRDISHLFTAPADGDFVLRLEHLFRQVQGGEQFVYRLRVQRDPQPDFRVICSPPDEIKVDSHVVTQGGRERLDILVWRLDGHNAPITIEARNLPAGVTAEPITIGPGVKWGQLIVTASPDAALSEKEIEIVATSERPVFVAPPAAPAVAVADKPAEKKEDKVAKKDEKNAEKKDEKPAEKKDEKPAEKKDEKPAEKKDDKAAAKKDEKPAEKKDDKVAAAAPPAPVVPPVMEKLVRQVRGGAIVWDTVNTPALARMTRSIVLAVREKAPFALTASPIEFTVAKGEQINLTFALMRSATMTNAVQLTGAGYQMPKGLEIPVKNIESGQNEGKLTLNTDKMEEGTYSFMVNGDGQVPVGTEKGKNVRCVYPSNSIRLTITPKKVEAKK